MRSSGACSKKGPPEARRAERAAERVTGVEEPHLIRQLFEAESVPRRSLGERRGFGDVPWGALDLIVVSVVGLFAQAVLMPMGYVGTAHLASPTADAEALSFFVGAVASYTVLLGAVWLFAIRRHHASAASLGFRPVDVRGLVGLLGVFALTVAGANLIVGSITALPTTQEFFRFAHRPTDIALLAVLIVVAAPVVEETFFRGFLLQGLARRFTFWPAAVVTSAVFALAHVWWQLYVPIFVLGLAFAWLFWRTGSLWASIAAHATINATSLFVALALGRW